MSLNFKTTFLDQLEPFQPQFAALLAPFSTWKCGGPADILVIAKNATELEKLVIIALENEVPYTILGHASNVLISDGGIRGLVIINKSREVKIVEEISENNKGKFLYFTDKLEKKAKNGNIIPDKFVRKLIFKDNKNIEHQILEFTIDTKTQIKQGIEEEYKEVYIEDIEKSAIEFTIFIFDNDQISQKITSDEIDYITLHKSSQVNVHLKNKLTVNIKTESGELGQNNNSRQPKIGFAIPYSLIAQKLGLADSDWKNLVANPADSFTITIQEVPKNIDYAQLYSETIDLIETSDIKKLICSIDNSQWLKSYEEEKDKSITKEQYSENVKDADSNLMIDISTKFSKEFIEHTFQRITKLNLSSNELNKIISTYKNFQFGTFGYSKDTLELANKSLILIPFKPDKILNPQEQITQEAQSYDIYITPRHSETGDPNFYSFADLDYDESLDENGQKIDLQKTTVILDSGVDLAYAIAWSLQNGLTGLQWFAGIPGTMGGALYNNIHGGTRHFSDNFVSCKVLIPINKVDELE